jgi:hypothetical protein
MKSSHDVVSTFIRSPSRVMFKVKTEIYCLPLASSCCFFMIGTAHTDRKFNCAWKQCRLRVLLAFLVRAERTRSSISATTAARDVTKVTIRFAPQHFVNNRNVCVSWAVYISGFSHKHFLFSVVCRAIFDMNKPSQMQCQMAYELNEHSSLCYLPALAVATRAHTTPISSILDRVLLEREKREIREICLTLCR